MKVLNGYKGDRTADGWKRLNNTLSADSISYDEMRRIKNFFDNYQGSKDNPEYILNGGEPMRTWVNNSLNTATAAIHDFKQAQKDAGIENAFIKPHEKHKGVAKPTTKKVQTKNVHKSVGDNNAVRTEDKKRPTVILSERQVRFLNESADYEDYEKEYGVEYIIRQFRSNPDGTLDWGALIDPNMYQKALLEFQKYGSLQKFPTKYIYQWMGIIMKNTALLEAGTEILGRGVGITPPEAVADVLFGEGNYEYNPQTDILSYINPRTGQEEETTYLDFVETSGLHDFMKMPDGSEAASDFGTDPIFEILSSYNSDSTPEETLIMINKILDLTHQHGDLSSIFIRGGESALSDISNGAYTESKERPTIVITEAQLKHLQRRRALTETAIISSADKLSQIPTFEDRYNFCLKAYGEPIGKGSAREVFQITDDKVLKLATNNDGLGQNLRESDYYNSVFDIFPLVYDADGNGKWIISEYVLPATEEDFKRCFGFDFEKFRYFIWACYAASEDAISPMKPSERNWLIEENNDLGLIDWYIQEENPPMTDLMKMDNYGLNSKGKIVLLDSGSASGIKRA
ncbi:MAG: hypothetical protein LUD72_03285 [Bacteroidales bacterium]|nr:hypothetical protein [Bacteroidales bacterium]